VALTNGASAPAEPGLVWSDVACTRVFEWRAAAGRRPEGLGRKLDTDFGRC
jgi:hypothetical protein